MLPFVALAVVGVVAYFLGDLASSPVVRSGGKMAASTAFVVAAFLGGATQSSYGTFIIAALALSWIGDAALLSTRKGPFMIGLWSFALAHVAYVAAFWTTSPSLVVVGVAGAVAVVPALRIHAWLAPNVPFDMRTPVRIYMVIITAMVAFSLGAGLQTGHFAIFVGAVLFYLSDLAVARNRFVEPGLHNELIGLPLYYAAQLTLAGTV